MAKPPKTGEIPKFREQRGCPKVKPQNFNPREEGTPIAPGLIGKNRGKTHWRGKPTWVRRPLIGVPPQ